MTKQQAWEAWVKKMVGGYPTSIERSSHGVAFSAGYAAGYAAAMGWKQENYLEDDAPIRKDMDAPGMY